jgi:hypothetical protein
MTRGSSFLTALSTPSSFGGGCGNADSVNANDDDDDDDDEEVFVASLLFF